MLEKNIDKISWDRLSTNPNAIDLLKKYPQFINWDLLTINENASDIIQDNIDKINWYWISENPVIFEIDYYTLNTYIEPYKEELMQKIFHPNKVWYFLEKYKYDIGDDEYIDDF